MTSIDHDRNYEKLVGGSDQAVFRYRHPTATIKETPLVPVVDQKSGRAVTQGNIKRKNSDYYVIVAFYLCFALLSAHLWPSRTTTQDRARILESSDTFQLFADPAGIDKYKVLGFTVAFTGLAMAVLNGLLFLLLWFVGGVRYTPTTHLREQAKTFVLNIVGNLSEFPI